MASQGLCEPLTCHPVIDNPHLYLYRLEPLRQSLSGTCDQVREWHNGSDGPGLQHRPRCLWDHMPQRIDPAGFRAETVEWITHSAHQPM